MDEVPASSHLDETGAVRMVDVSEKDATRRVARASGRISMSEDAVEAIARGDLAKGEALAVARVAGIQAAKETSRTLPLCHPLPLEHVAVDLAVDSDPPGVRAESEVVVTARTGAEMEALSAVTAALLTIYDMAKSIDRGMTIGSIRLERKSGGRSGAWSRGPGS